MRAATAIALVLVGCGASEGAASTPPHTGATAAAVAKESTPSPPPAPATPEPREARSERREARPERAGRTGEAPAKISARHVLIQYMGAERAGPSVVRTSDQARKVAEEVLARAKAGEDFARLAVEFSDEPGAANRGGSLGRFGKGQMVPAFDAAAFKLAVAEIALVETPFGFHVVQRTD